jgi:hypothetical protein
MSIQWAGLLFAVTTFTAIAIGHVLVRRLHPKLGTRPGIPLVMLGVGVMVISALVKSNHTSGVLGIIAITTIWDGIEFYRQEKRDQRGRG